MRRLLLALPVGLALLGAGCALGPDFRRPNVPMEAAYRQSAAAGESIANLPWWQTFGDPVLHDLIRTALVENQDIRTAYWRVEEAAAILGFTRADQFPSFRYGAGAQRTETSDQLGPRPGGIDNDFMAGADVAWEIDLWGRLRRATESARAQLLAAEEFQRGVTITLVSQVAQAYFTLRGLDARLDISRRTLASRHAATELIRTRFRGGIVSELDVRQAEVEEATAAAAVPVFERQVAQVENALAVLLGRPPRDIPRGDALAAGSVPATAPAGLPSELVERRPDVREAEELAHAQMARIGAAEALRFPTLSLTGSAGLESNEWDNLTESDANFWSIGGSITGPIFEFGKNRRRVEAEKARTEQAVLQYEKTVINAFREVEDALVALRAGADEYAARNRQVDSAAAAARLARARYDGGVTSYLEVLDIERSLFSAELSASSALEGRYVALVQLYKALGGGWQAPP